MEELRKKAFNKWAELAYRDDESDYRVNLILEEIAGPKYDKYNEFDDPIFDIIQTLDADELFEFLESCEAIEL